MYRRKKIIVAIIAISVCSCINLLLTMSFLKEMDNFYFAVYDISVASLEDALARLKRNDRYNWDYLR